MELDLFMMVDSSPVHKSKDQDFKNALHKVAFCIVKSNRNYSSRPKGLKVNSKNVM